MASENPAIATARRNRIIAIAAGAITVTAIVVAFAAEYLDLPWKWLRPGVELLLLAELVGLVVLERHQLFEPVRENVGAMRTRVEEIHALISENTRSSGQVTACPSTTELFRTMARVLREALAREQGSPQILRGAWLAGRLRPPEEPDLIIEFRGVARGRVGVPHHACQPPARTRPAVVRSDYMGYRDFGEFRPTHRAKYAYAFWREREALEF